MDTILNSRTCLNADQTKAVLAIVDGLPEKLRDLERIELDPEESCRALLANFIYAWSIAEASKLPVITELAEIGIIEMSVRLGLNVKKENQSANWYWNTKN
jgi:hypothetical protein